MRPVKVKQSLYALVIAQHLGWSRGASTRCRVPESISKHGTGKGKWPKGERGLGKLESAVILQHTGLLVPVGSGRYT